MRGDVIDSMTAYKLRRLLGGCTPRRFLAQFWRRSRCSFAPRCGLRRFAPPAQLADLACRDDVESGSQSAGRQWDAQQGPFRRASAAGRRRAWSLLADVNHLSGSTRALDRFNFVPHARLDDHDWLCAGRRGWAALRFLHVFLPQARDAPLA